MTMSTFVDEAMLNPQPSHPEDSTVLVLGGTGMTGRRVAARLRARGIPVRIASRTGQPPFDWDDPTTWARAVRGVAAVYVVYSPDLGLLRAPRVIRSFTELAVDSGATRLVLLSGRGRDDVEASEHAIRDSGEQWTILRTAWLHQNFSEGILLPAVRAGLVALPANDVPEPFVDAADVADVAVAALTEDGHNGREYELTGPELLTFTQTTTLISQAIGREVAYRSVTPQLFTRELLRRNIPRAEAALLATVFTTVLGGRNAHLTTDVHQVLGRPHRTFADYVRKTAATGVWEPDGPASSGAPA